MRLLSWLRRHPRTSVALLAPLWLPALQCALLNVVDPPVTLTMLERVADHHAEAGEWRWVDHASIDIDDLPVHVPQAAISSEDARFLAHGGFDREAIGQAWEAYKEREAGEKLVGGSTISQQVARNVFLWQERSWLRKGLEAWYTVWLELLVPKKRILEVYLNVAETGPMTFGVEAAAWRYFDRPARDLNRHQAAIIVALLPAPNTWKPGTPRVQRKAAWILRQSRPEPRW